LKSQSLAHSVFNRARRIDSKSDSKICKAGFRELAFGLNTGMREASAGGD
jgi:hypothetical protein